MLFLVRLLFILFFVGDLFAETISDEFIHFGSKKINEQDQINLPLFELGLASINSWTHDYPGASQGQFRPIIVPTFVYRGSALRSDTDGSRARFFNNERLEFSMSAGGNFPVNSDDNHAREGMDDLGLILQAGPRLMYFLINRPNLKLYFDLAARTGFATGSRWRDWRGVGISGDIGINYRQKWSKYELFLLLFTSAASYELHKYFYDVRIKDVTSERKFYHSRSGYSGTNLLLAVSRDFTRAFSVFAGGGLLFLDGHVNSGSPLFRENINARAVIGLKYTFIYSKDKAKE